MLGREGYHTLLSVLFYVINILCHRSQFLCLTIDNRLAVVTNDCYSRISIGSKLSDPDVAFQFTVTSLTECKEQCSKRGNICNAFSFGVGVKGNGTCAISNQTSVMLENLQTHTDYDVYVKKQQVSPWCDFDHLYGNFAFRSEADLTKTDADKTNDEEVVTNLSNTLSTLVSHSVSLSVSPVNRKSQFFSKEDIANYKLLGIYDQSINHHGRFLSGDDSRNRILASLTNRNERTALNSLFVSICHRKVQAGRKMIKEIIERLVNCENLEDCCRVCDYEKSFVCKGFNHRHRTDDSQCVCELTSTPYSRMDADDDFLIDTNYDYYEREPNCLPSTRRDDPSQSKGSSKLYERIKQNTWLNQKDIEKEDGFQELSTSINRPPFYRENYPLNGKLTISNRPTHGSIRFQEQFHYDDPSGFVPLKNTRNWNDNWKQYFQIRHSDFAVNENTFPEYRLPNYDKGSYANVRSSSFIKPRLRDQSVSGQNGFMLLNTNEYTRGRYLNHVDKQSTHEEREQPQATRKCSIRAITGSKLSRNVLRKTCVTHNLEQCEQLCINETDFPCESFAYRYKVLITNPTDNCLLSDLSYRNINFYTDLEPDRDYTSYIMIRDAKKHCYSKQSMNQYPLEECFSRIRSGFAIPTYIIKKLLFANDLGECQFACTTSQEFVCKSLVFKYLTEYPGHTDERKSSNCFLTDWSSEEINPVDMPDMDGAELYERSSSYYGCETYTLPLSMLNTILPGYNTKESSSIRKDQLCYLEHHRPCKLMPHAVISSMRTVTKPECQQRCSATRNTGGVTIPCMSFNYIIDTDNTRDNCLLSDISMQDLRPNLDYTYDDDDDDDDDDEYDGNNHMLYTWKDFDPYCSLTMNHFHAINITPAFDKYDHPHLFTTLNHSSGRTTHLFNTDIPISIHDSIIRDENEFKFEPHQYDFKHKPAFIGDESKPLHGSAHFERDFSFSHSRELSTFQRYTVNGYPCKNDTVCQQNEITGFWSCEIEQAEYGSWDYCCEPNHRCGFSRGYHYPWCYVGLNEDQWRPCSETYYPYYLSTKNPTFYRQSPIYIARHWPVIYFHELSPNKNCSVSNSNNQDLYQNHRSDYRPH
ncbi:uncharacterized protein LOC114880487 isoform X2 [Osmia bicornis bicornis]|uniref:uncharacterized protein LOC114880487 isoform X2 n=1 Tax=Osmia bicornis bicornis TaxID=1437191 RepID=UPI001EAEDFE0|nr:uncharacterized protein LOC114880487 isoform X2 [Osmia bicornis bicornis]